jgi:hypothetical protein
VTKTNGDWSPRHEACARGFWAFASSRILIAIISTTGVGSLIHAKAEAHELNAGGRVVKVVWLRITAAGRRAIG